MSRLLMLASAAAVGLAGVGCCCFQKSESAPVEVQTIGGPGGMTGAAAAGMPPAGVAAAGTGRTPTGLPPATADQGMKQAGFQITGSAADGCTTGK